MKRYRQKDQDGGNKPLMISAELCAELNICPRCNGDLGETAQRSTSGILGPYSRCRCPKLVETPVGEPIVIGTLAPGEVLTEEKVHRIWTHFSKGHDLATEILEKENPVPTTSLEVLKKPFEGSVAELRRKSAHLDTLPLGVLKANVAKEYDDEAAAYLKMLEASELTERIAESHETHKFLVKMKKVLADPGEYLRGRCKQVLIAYERDRREKAEAERRKREEEARLEAYRIRQEEVIHLANLGHDEEAKSLASEPLLPISLPDEKAPAGKVASISFTDVWKVDAIENPALFFEWLAKNEAYWGGIELKEMFWKSVLTHNKGTLKIPGLKVVKSQEVRNRG